MTYEESSIEPEIKKRRKFSQSLLFYEQGGQESLKSTPLSRREFFKSLGASTYRTAVISALNVASSKIQKIITKSDKKLEEREAEARKALARGELKVKYFAWPIISVAGERVSYNSTASLAKLSGAYFFGDNLGLASRNLTTRRNALIGMVSGVAGKIIDLFSTDQAFGIINTSKFVEYGFDTYFREGNFLFSKHPSRLEIILKGIPLTIISGFVGTTFPFVGRGYFCASPFITAHNFKIAETIIEGVKIGDGIKAMIEERTTQEKIEAYIESLRSDNL